MTVHRPGTFTVTATSVYHPKISASLTVTAAYADFSVQIVGPDSVVKDGRTTAYSVKFTGNAPDSTVYWSVDDSQVATVDAKGRLVPRDNGIVTLKAVSAYNTAVYDTKEIVVQNQSGLFTVTYQAGTLGEVTGLPKPEKVRGEHTLSEQIPKREGYIFLGWTTDEQSTETVRTINVAADRQVYALWGKGISCEFNGDSKGITVSNGNASLSPDGYLVCDTKGLDGDIRLIVDKFSVDPSAYRVVQMRMATDKKSFVQMFYKVEKTENGVTKRYGYDENGYRDAEDYCVYGEHKYDALEQWFDVQFNMYNTWRPGNPNWYMGTADSVVGLWIDITNVPDATVYLDYVRILDVTRTITYETESADEVQGMPQPQKAVFGEKHRPSASPKRKGYTFVGWSKKPDDMTHLLSDFTVTDDITLYAQWVINSEIAPDGKTAVIGSMNCAETNAVLVQAGKNATVTLTYTGKNGVTVLSETTNALGYAVFDLSAETALCDVTVSIKTGGLLRADAVRLDYALKTAVSVKDSSGSGKDQSYEYDDTVEDVPNEKTAYGMGGEAEEIEPFEGYANVKEPILVNFDTENDRRVIETLNDLRYVGTADSVLCLRAIDSSNTYFETAKLALDAQSHRYVALKVKKTTLDASVLRMYFLPETEKAYYTGNSEIRSLSEDYQMVVYDLGDKREWNGVIDRLLFSFVGKAEGDFKIDWMLFTDELPEHYDDVPGEKTVFSTVNRMPAAFADVSETDWFYSDVAKVYRIGLMNGVSQESFDPKGKVTIAQAITLAVRLSLRADGKEEVLPTEKDEPWYMPYVRAALEKRLIQNGEYTDYEAYAVRRDVALLLSKALPGAWYKKINYFTEVPDMDSSDKAYSAVLRLYNAGILTGFDSKYRFYPDTDIDRAQVAAMVNRIAIEDSRKRVVTETERNLLRMTFAAEEIRDAAVLESCTGVTFEVKDGMARGKSVGGDPIVYFLSLLDNVDTSLYSRIRIGMRWNRERIENPIPAGCQIFYTTASSGWSSGQCVVPTWDGTVDADGVGEFVFDFDPKSKPFSSVKSFRLDPFDVADAEFSLAYIIIE